MKVLILVCLFSVLLVTYTNANFYGKRAGDGTKSLKEIIRDMRSQEDTMSADEVLDRIEMLIQLYRQGVSKSSLGPLAN